MTSHFSRPGSSSGAGGSGRSAPARAAVLIWVLVAWVREPSRSLPSSREHALVAAAVP